MPGLAQLPTDALAGGGQEEIASLGGRSGGGQLSEAITVRSLLSHPTGKSNGPRL